MRCLRGCNVFPSLALLNPLEFLVTVNHSGLWQRHVAWAKPDGKDLRTYISSQYSTNMVLLSLLLGIQINVFFNSAPEMIELRQKLATKGPLSSFPNETVESRIDTSQIVVAVYTSLKFWIGFLIVLNICVTIMGILATFTTWSMVAAISDRNAHCLLRSSMGQYVTTLSPRLVVASVYVFMLWFLLFVVEIVAMSNPLFWALLLWVAFMFFSIVIPLSVFGRLILHTGAMAQRPVLSEELERELLPNGLHASLVIRAHYRHRKNTSVTNQYRRQHEQNHVPQQDAGNNAPLSDDNDITPSRSNMTNGTASHYFMASDGTMFASDHERMDNLDDTSLVYTEAGRSASLFGALTDYSAGTTNNDDTKVQGSRGEVSFEANRKDVTTVTGSIMLPRGQQHRRLPNSETTIDLPPAAILNMSLTAREFNELINNAMDTSSIGCGSIQIDQEPFAVANRGDLRPIDSPSMIPTTNHTEGKTHSPLRLNNRSGPPQYALTQSSSAEETSVAAVRGHQHHRTASSSRFLLHEWAQESNIRDVYGIPPPTEIPHEICLPSAPQRPTQGSPPWSPRSLWNRWNQNKRRAGSRSHVDSPTRKTPESSHHSRDNSNVGLENTQQLLRRPFLPELYSDDQDDEVTGGTLLGEAFLPPSQERR